MKKPIKIFSILILSLFVSGCGEPTLDTSSEESEKKSVEEMTESLSESKRKEFQLAIVGIKMSVCGEITGSPFCENKKVDKKVNNLMDGKTVEEIIKFRSKIWQSQQKL